VIEAVQMGFDFSAAGGISFGGRIALRRMRSFFMADQASGVCIVAARLT
jgi:hypothetical protein